MLAQESATGRLQGLSINNGEPIQIESDKLEVLDAEHKANFIGNVNVKQGPTLMKAAKMTVFYAQDGSGSAATGSGNIDAHGGFEAASTSSRTTRSPPATRALST